MIVGKWWKLQWQKQKDSSITAHLAAAVLEPGTIASLPPPDTSKAAFERQRHTPAVFCL
jgi:hypothetical protein